VLLAAAVGAVISLAPSSASAADWMFRRSYYSHVPQPGVDVEYPLPESRSAYRGAWVGNTPGFAARGGYRINRLHLHSGDSIDTTVIYEGWFNFRD
jgi:hypothetical protein